MQEPPLFLVRCDEAELAYAPLLAGQIDLDDISVYGLPNASPDDPKVRTLEGMATRLIRTIHRIQPLGPYRIAGWGFGGILAYEIAFQLTGADETVEFLGLIDTEYPAESFFESPVDCCQPNHGSNAALEMEIFRSNRPNIEDRQRNADRPTRPIIKYLCGCKAASIGYSVRPLSTPIHLFFSEVQGKTRTSIVGSWSRALPADQLRIVDVLGMNETMDIHSNIEALGKAVSVAIHHNVTPLGAPSSAQDHCPITPLQIVSDGCQLFCIPGAGASVTSFNDCVSGLSGSWSVYGLQPRGLDGVSIPHTTVESCAESYLQAMPNSFITRPIHLLGHSLGGWIALELAQRLRARGCDVASLTIVDSAPPDEDELALHEYTHSEMLIEWMRIAEVYFGKPLKIEAHDLGRRSQVDQRRILHNRLVSIGALPRNSHSEVLIGPLAAFAAGLRTRYTPRSAYVGPARLILATSRLSGVDYSDRELFGVIRRWKQWIPNLTPTTVLANHISVLRSPQVNAISNLFINCSIRRRSEGFSAS